MTFKELEIIEPILRALELEGYTQPTPIQEQSIPILLRKKDLLGCAQTGTGKTAAFAIPILQHLFLDPQRNKGRRKIKALIVTPTRELAIQIGEGFSTYGKFTGITNTVIFGGVKQSPQTDALRRGIDVLVATPGRLLDLINQGYISLRDVRFSVLDEADHMLDMGFIHDIRKIIDKLPTNRQSLFFSATMPPAIMDLSKKILGNPERVTIKPEQATTELVEQAVFFVSKSNKPKLLVHLFEEHPMDSVLIFSKTKHGADKIVKFLAKANIKSDAIHGNKSQAARQRALNSFKEKKSSVLVATDIAARGIDVDQLSLVINYDLPNVSETYIHRIGRTGRAEKSGIAWSFCDQDERSLLRDIEKLIQQKVPVREDNPFLDTGTEGPSKKQAQPQRSPRNPQGASHNSQRTSHNQHRRPASAAKTSNVSSRVSAESSSDGSAKPRRRHFYPRKRS